MPENKLEQGAGYPESCLCPKIKCQRHGKCAECVIYHKKMPPFCKRETKEMKKAKMKELRKSVKLQNL